MATKEQPRRSTREKIQAILPEEAFKKGQKLKQGCQTGTIEKVDSREIKKPGQGLRYEYTYTAKFSDGSTEKLDHNTVSQMVLNASCVERIGSKKTPKARKKQAPKTAPKPAPKRGAKITRVHAKAPKSNHKPRQNEGKENSYPSKVVTVLSDTEDEEETTVFSSSARLLQEMVIDLKTRERMNENSLRLAQSTIKKLETDLEISNAAKADKAKDLGNALQNNAFLSEENKTLQTAVGHLNQALAASKASLVSEKAEKEQALRSAFEVSETLAQANSRVDRLKSENASLSRQLSVTTEELNRMKSAKLASDETASDAQLQIEKLNSALAEAASKYNELEASFSHEKLVSYALASKLAPARDKDTTTSGPPDTSFTTSKVSNQSVEGSSQKNTPFHDPDNQTIVKMKAMTATLKAMTATLTANAQTKASKANLTPEVVQKRPTALNQMDKKKTE